MSASPPTYACARLTPGEQQNNRLPRTGHPIVHCFSPSGVPCCPTRSSPLRPIPNLPTLLEPSILTLQFYSKYTRRSLFGSTEIKKKLVTGNNPLIVQNPRTFRGIHTDTAKPFFDLDRQAVPSHSAPNANPNECKGDKVYVTAAHQPIDDVAENKCTLAANCIRSKLETLNTRELTLRSQPHPAVVSSSTCLPTRLFSCPLVHSSTKRQAPGNIANTHSERYA